MMLRSLWPLAIDDRTPDFFRQPLCQAVWLVFHGQRALVGANKALRLGGGQGTETYNSRAQTTISWHSTVPE